MIGTGIHAGQIFHGMTLGGMGMSRKGPGAGPVAAPFKNGTGKESTMIKIEAIIKPYRLTEVQEVLSALGIQGMTITEVKGFGRQKGHVEIYRGAEYQVNYVPKVMVMVVVPDTVAESVIEAIQKAAYTGKIGDGKIFMSHIDDAMRIRTKEMGADAL